ncbi:TnsA endonuclease N-terminal domain-containing protein [Endozoicomonas sp. ALB032]|uniref:TnsA endonuclease N-terminal domain-containing protein n=1 Tax=Endozoicomonas sp. ALB032 TaxID=3403082 RepID=UPI003BB58CF6
MPVRTIPKNYRNVTGRVSLRTSDGVSAGFESSLERDLLICLDMMPDVVEIEEQPVVVPYALEGKAHTYTPDVLFKYRSGVTVLAEVKYREDLFANWSEIKPKIKAARKYAKDRGWEFKILTEKEIQTVWLDNCRFLRRYSIEDCMPAMVEHTKAAIESMRHTTVSGLLNYLSADRWRQAEYQTVVWALLSEGGISADLTSPLNLKSELWPGEREAERQHEEF